jgi:hypothetical protein
MGHTAGAGGDVRCSDAWMFNQWGDETKNSRQIIMLALACQCRVADPL